MKGLEKITGRIVKDAEAARDTLLAQAGKEADAALAGWKEKADALLARGKAEGEQEAQALLSRAAAAAGTQASSALLSAKGDMLDRAFTLAAERLCATEMNEKLAFLTALAEKMLDEAFADEAAAKENEGEDFVPCDSFVLSLSPADTESVGKALVSRLDAKAKAAGKKLTLGAPASIEGGAVLKMGDIENNCSLSRLIEQVRREKEGELLTILFPAEGIQ